MDIQWHFSVNQLSWGKRLVGAMLFTKKIIFSWDATDMYVETYQHPFGEGKFSLRSHHSVVAVHSRCVSQVGMIFKIKFVQRRYERLFWEKCFMILRNRKRYYIQTHDSRNHCMLVTNNCHYLVCVLLALKVLRCRYIKQNYCLNEMLYFALVITLQDT